MIEAGRMKKLNSDERFYPFCPERIEDKLHSLLYCPVYCPLQTSLVDPVLKKLHNARALTGRQNSNSYFATWI